MAKIPQNSAMLFYSTRNDELLRRVLFLKLGQNGFELDGADRRDIINRMMEPIGSHRWKAFVEERRLAHRR